jgi:hypothetical protein
VCAWLWFGVWCQVYKKVVGRVDDRCMHVAEVKPLRWSLHLHGQPRPIASRRRREGFGWGAA